MCLVLGCLGTTRKHEGSRFPWTISGWHNSAAKPSNITLYQLPGMVMVASCWGCFFQPTIGKMCNNTCKNTLNLSLCQTDNQFKYSNLNDAILTRRVVKYACECIYILMGMWEFSSKAVCIWTLCGLWEICNKLKLVHPDFVFQFNFPN